MQLGSWRPIHNQSLRALNAPTRIDELSQEFRRSRGNWGTAISMFKHNKVAVFGIDDERTSFLAHEESA
jgi:hypothetical protein